MLILLHVVVTISERHVANKTKAFGLLYIFDAKCLGTRLLILIDMQAKMLASFYPFKVNVYVLVFVTHVHSCYTCNVKQC